MHRGASPWSCKESDTTDLQTHHFYLFSGLPTDCTCLIHYMGWNPISPVLQLLQLKTQMILDKLSSEPKTNRQVLMWSHHSILWAKVNDPGTRAFSARWKLWGYSLHASHFPFYFFHFSSHWASLVAQLVKNLPAMRVTGFDPWVRKIPWRSERLPTPVFWPGEFHGVAKSQTEQLSLSLSFYRQEECWSQGGASIWGREGWSSAEIKRQIPDQIWSWSPNCLLGTSHITPWHWQSAAVSCLATTCQKLGDTEQMAASYRHHGDHGASSTD